MRRSCELARTAVKMLKTENGNVKIVRKSSILANGRGDTISASHGDKTFKSTKPGNDPNKPSTKNDDTTSTKPVMSDIKNTVELDKNSLSSVIKDSSKLSKNTQPIIDTKKDKINSIDYRNSPKDKEALPIAESNANPPTSNLLPDSILDLDNSKVQAIMDCMPLKSEIVTSQKLPDKKVNDGEVTYVPVTGYERLNYVTTCLPKAIITKKPVEKIAPIQSEGPTEATKPPKMPEIVEPPRINALAVKPIESVTKMPDEPQPPDSSSDSRSPFGFLFRIITLAVKLAILGGAVCWTQSEGVWGDGEKSEKCLRRWAGSMKEQHCVCMPKTETESIYPTMNEITDKVVNSYNSAVSYCIHKASRICNTNNCTCGCGEIEQCGDHSKGDGE